MTVSGPAGAAGPEGVEGLGADGPDGNGRQRIGWLGLGAMGSPMALRLAAAGHLVTAYDPKPGRAASLGSGVVPAQNPAQAAAAASVLVVMVATPAQADTALFGDDGAAPNLRPGTQVLLLATLGRAWARALPGRLPSGVSVVDAPVSGGVSKAGDGSLLIMAAGAAGPARTVLRELGEVADVGDEPGQGQAMKMVNQVLCGIHIAAAAEALVLAESMGIDPAQAWDTVRRGAGASFMLDNRGERMVRGVREPVRSALALFVKDLGLVLDEAAAAGMPAPVAAAAARSFSAAAEGGRAGHDDSELFDFVRSQRGT